MRTKQEILNGESEVEFLTKCAIDFGHWATHVFGLTIEPYHLEWVDILKRSKRVALMAFTGSGKSELLGIAYPLWLVWFQRNIKVLLVSKSLPQSTSILYRIKKVIEDNELLHELIPPNKPEHMWCSKTDMETSTNGQIACKPYSENLKGYHVDYILADEVATYQEFITFYNVLLTRVESRDGTICAISTPEHIADLMMQLIDNPNFAGGIYPAECDGELLAPARFPREKLDRIREEIGNAAYEREYLCNPRAEVDCSVFTPALIHDCYNPEAYFRHKSTGSQTFIGVDLAVADGPRADFDAYSVVEHIDSTNTLIYAERHKGLRIESKIQRIIALYIEYESELILVDKSHIGQAIIDGLISRGYPAIGVDFHPSSRANMLVNLRQQLERGTLVLPWNQSYDTTRNYIEILTIEMLGFMEGTTKAGTKTYLSKAAHDDTVMSLCLALKGATEQGELCDMVAI